jgi:hypothetical protein
MVKIMTIKILIFIFFFFYSIVISQNVNINKYIWETAINYNSSAPDYMIKELRKEIDTLLKYNSWAPLRVYFGDYIIDESYFSYLEPGRVITTLARAYKYLTTAQRIKVGEYIRLELENKTTSPWVHKQGKSLLDPRYGKRREYHMLEKIWGYDKLHKLNFRPLLHVLYGLWLYAYNSKDFAIIHENWDYIKNYYTEYAYREINLPSGLGATIAMIRMAEFMNDAQTRQACINHLTQKLITSGFLDSAFNFAYNGFNGWDAPYPYNGERERDLIFMSWIFLNISPEICRFLDDYYRQQTIQHHIQQLKKYPLWWIRSVQYWTRWTGDESIGLPSEVCGMASPIERWIMKKNASEFSVYVKSSPYCYADCHWIEMLIDAIELFGQTAWKDIRTYYDNQAPEAIKDLRVEYFNSKFYLIWTTPSDNGIEGKPLNYWFRYSSSPLNDNYWEQYPLIEYNKSIKKAGEIDTLVLSSKLGNDSIYYIAVKSEDEFKNLSAVSNQAIIKNYLYTDETGIQKTFYLSQNFPNPFNPETKLNFYISNVSKVKVIVYNTLGEVVDLIINDKIFPKGEHTIAWKPNKLASGIYLISFEAKEQNSPVKYKKIIKTVLLK